MEADFSANDQEQRKRKISPKRDLFLGKKRGSRRKEKNLLKKADRERLNRAVDKAEKAFGACVKEDPQEEEPKYCLCQNVSFLKNGRFIVN